MRLIRILLLAPLALALVPGATAAGTKAYSCGSPVVTVLLWPHGHKAIRSVHFPAKTTPNIQVYRYDPRFAGGNFLLYADARGNLHPVPEFCGKSPSVAAKPIAQSQTVTGKRAVTCTERAILTFEVTRQPHGVKVLGRLSGQALFVATVTRRGKAKITFDADFCQIASGP